MDKSGESPGFSRGGAVKTGKQLKLDGVESVTARNSLWMSEALAAFRKFIRNRPLFTIEQFRSHYRNEPNHPNAWGGFTIAAQSQRLIECVRYCKALSPKARHRVIVIYRKA